MNIEKRKHPRIPIAAKVTRVGDDKKDFYFTKDLSLGGVFLQASQEIPVGSLINLELAIQGLKDLIRIKGKVVRVEMKQGKIEGIGVQFVEVDKETVKHLKILLKNDDNS